MRTAGRRRAIPGVSEAPLDRSSTDSAISTSATLDPSAPACSGRISPWKPTSGPRSFRNLRGRTGGSASSPDTRMHQTTTTSPCTVRTPCRCSVSATVFPRSWTRPRSTWPSSRPYRLRIEAIGSRIRGYVDGELRVEAVDRTMRTGRPGLITSGAQANFDGNVVATPSPLTTLFADTFNGQFVNDHWQVVSGLWNHAIAGSQGLYAQTSTQVQGRVLTGVDTHDQVMEAEASSGALTAGASYGLMARYSGDGNFYYLRVGENNQISLQSSSTAPRSSWIARRSLSAPAHGTDCGSRCWAMHCAGTWTVASSSKRAISRTWRASTGSRLSGRLRSSITYR